MKIFITVTATGQWKPLKMATMLRLLKPVESKWKELGRSLLKRELQYKIDTIDADCRYKDYHYNALDDVFSNWLGHTRRANRTWQTLCDAADNPIAKSLKGYLQAKNLKSKFSMCLDFLLYYTILYYTIYISLGTLVPNSRD